MDKVLAAEAQTRKQLLWWQVLEGGQCRAAGKVVEDSQRTDKNITYIKAAIQKHRQCTNIQYIKIQSYKGQLRPTPYAHVTLTSLKHGFAGLHTYATQYTDVNTFEVFPACISAAAQELCTPCYLHTRAKTVCANHVVLYVVGEAAVAVVAQAVRW